MAASLLVATAFAFEPIGADFRISQAGTDGDAARAADATAAAYNSAANEYLVIWQADGGTTDDIFQVFGQRVSASGAELGSDFQISHGESGNPEGEEPDVAYNPTANEYLVVWSGDGAGTDAGSEVFGQRLNAAGSEVGTDDLRISDAGTGFTAEPALAYNPTANEYLITWESNDISPATLNDTEVFGQRLSAAGAETGPDDFRISNVGPEGEDFRRGSRPAVIFNPNENEYLVTWENDSLSTDAEIFGQQVSAVGTQVGIGDFRISTTGTDVDGRRAGAPAVVHNPAANEYLVIWNADSATGEEEIFGQRLSAAVAEVGTDDFRISSTIEGDGARRAFEPTLAYAQDTNQYVVAWDVDGLETNDEYEIFGQVLSADGAETGPDDFRISSAADDGNANRDAEDPDVAYNSGADELLVVWQADDLATNDEFEVFGRRLAQSRPPQTRITKHPKKRTERLRARFKFVAVPPAGATLECKLDRRPFRRCSSPFGKRVRPGRHKFRVRATTGGLTDPSPAKFRWRVLGESG